MPRREPDRQPDAHDALTRVRAVLARVADDAVEKSIWGSPMGKSRIAARIVAELPAHKVYAEPFAGGAQVLFAKEPSEVEAVNDLDPDIAFAFRFAKAVTAEQVERLRRKKWVGDKEHFKKLLDGGVPSDPVERFYRFAYLARFSFNKLRRGTMPEKNVGAEARFVAKLEAHAPRLRKVQVREGDFEKVVREFDSPDTFFFLDPPYAGYDADTRQGAGHKNWDEGRFGRVLRSIKGKFLCTYGIRGDADLFKGFHVRRWVHTAGVGTSPGHGQSKATTLVATNYDPAKIARWTPPSAKPAATASTKVAKTIWGSPAGKKRLGDRLAALLPPHVTYVEPFAGSGAVLFAKEAAKVEVLNDADPEIAGAYRAIKALSAADLERLRKMEWTGDKATFKRLIDTEPSDPVAKLHRFLYLTHFSYGKLRGKSFNPNAEAVEARTIERIEEFRPRLAHVQVFSGDYEKVVTKFDGPKTVFYLDPPYPGYNVQVGEGDFDEERFFKVLRGIRGKFLMTYGIRGKLPDLLKTEPRFRVKRIRPPRSIRAMRGVGGPTVLTTLLVSNYDLVEKAQPFGTFGGSHHYAKRILPLIPAHKVYVEPFAGAAALLHAKEPSEKEVLADLDEDVVFLHRSIKAMTPATLAKLRRFEWTVTPESFVRARDMQPQSELARFYKLVFVRTHARDCRPDGTHPAQNHLGSTTDPEKYLKAAERLRDVTILRQDYRKTIAQFDSPETFFFLDPPYPGEWFDKDAAVDIEEFVTAAKGIRGRFIAVLNDTPEHAAAFKRLGHVFRLKVHEASGTGGAKTASRLFCANFPVRKAADVEELFAEDGTSPFAKDIPLIKGADPADERFVLGVVLEPETVDAQGDVYSAEEVRQAAHRFMEEFGGLGLMHRYRVNDQVKVLESYVAPSELSFGEAAVRKGTWLLAVRVLSDELWAQVRDGGLTGFSIGGSARRVPEGEAQPVAGEAA